MSASSAAAGLPGADRPAEGRARILVPSMRRIEQRMSHCLRYEFEDLLVAVDNAEILAPPAPPSSLFHKVLRRAKSRLNRSTPRVVRALLPGRRRRAGDARYDLAIVGCCDLSDLRLLGPRWRGTARVTVCIVDDLYFQRDRRRAGEFALLGEFDHVFLGCEGSVHDVSRVIGKPCHYLPFSVDTLAFCPYPRPPRRVIDLYAMGRRPAGTHAGLQSLAANRGWFYLFDTCGDGPVTSHAEHRQRLADLIGRSRYFLVNPGKMNRPFEIQGQIEIGYRYFEGAAAGAVMVGERPRTPSFDRLFDWPDVVIPLPYDSPNVEEAIAALERDPARVERIRRTNVAQSLRRHDHVHRWAQILSVAGLPLTAAMERRLRLLEQRAAEVEAGIPSAEVSAWPRLAGVEPGTRFDRADRPARAEAVILEPQLAQPQERPA